MVVHTGDIANAVSLQRFSKLNCKCVGVYGNNDRKELGIIEVAHENNLNFKEPPLSLTLHNKRIVIFHEPDHIDKYLSENTDTDIVLHGHTHRYRYENINGTVLFNPGESAGILKGKNAVGIINLDNLNFKRIFF